MSRIVIIFLVDNYNNIIKSEILSLQGNDVYINIY